MEMSYEEKYKELHSLVGKAIRAATRGIGVIQAGPDERGLYRITGEKGTMILPVMDRLSVKVGQTVIFGKKDDEFLAILEVIPEALVIKSEVPDFSPVQWEQIGGLSSQVERIRETIETPLRYADLYKEFNIPSLKGVMLYGPPGCGKTMIAKAIATTVMGSTSKADVADAFHYCKGGELLSPYVGATEARIKEMFDACRKYHKKTGIRATIFIDEAEAIVPTRGSRVSSDVDSTIVPTFLSEMDGFEDGSPFVILATNHPSQIDPAIQRAGRIDLKIEITRPSKEDAVDIFGLYIKKTLVAEGSPEELAKHAAEELFNNDVRSSISGALISTIVTEATQSAIKRYINRRGIKGVTKEDITLTIKTRFKNEHVSA